MHKIKALKPIFLVVALAFFCNASSAQTAVEADTVPAYKRIPTIPPFTLRLVPDSAEFTKADLKKKRATIIMIFSPDCEHCIHSTEDLLAHYDLFKKVQIVMATPLAWPHIQKFWNDFKIADYPNIRVGLDNNYFLGTFYQLHSYPAIIVYDKKGNFKEFFDGSVKWEKIAKVL